MAAVDWAAPAAEGWVEGMEMVVGAAEAAAATAVAERAEGAAERAAATRPAAATAAGSAGNESERRWLYEPPKLSFAERCKYLKQNARLVPNPHL